MEAVMEHIEEVRIPDWREREENESECIKCTQLEAQLMAHLLKNIII